jgi:hypothetical protein
VFDNKYLSDTAHTTVTITQPNRAPAIPLISGFTDLITDTDYSFAAQSDDADNDDIEYTFDWDDGTYSGWIGPYTSGAKAEASHTWTEQGDYEIKVKSKDSHGVQSQWSDPLSIKMPKNISFSLLIQQFFDRLLEICKTIFSNLQNLIDFNN